MGHTIFLNCGVEIRSVAGRGEGAHASNECGCAIDGMATGIIDQRVLDDCVDRPTFLAGQFMGKVPGLGASNGELRGGHAIKITF